jgi:DHA3 family macrolide efflux protein-like MFS transporter
MPAASMYPLMTMKYFQGTVSQAGLIEAIYSTGMLIGGTIIGLFGKWQDRMKPVIIAFFLVGIPTGISGIFPGNQTGFLWFAALNIIEGIATPIFYNAFNGNDSTKLSSRRVRADSRRFEFFV